MDKLNRTKKKQPDDFQGTIAELLAQMGIVAVDLEYFTDALTHSSYANEHGVNSNERLEFLGDSVLGLIVCQFLFENYPNYNEGKLAKLKSTMVSAPVLARLATNIGLDQYIRLGYGELRSSGRTKLNILADVFEAMIGAYFMNFGFDKTKEFFLPLIKAELPEVIAHLDEVNAKTNLQELTQAKGIKPEYRIIKEEGPPHNRFFWVEVLINNKVAGTGTGRSIKEAQNKAALAALNNLQQ
ncbi:MAG TPA: ribonuclease III [Bacillota bacterium]|jgi:ribonuclease-3|nr:ribonuclease III [Bacillota bacterium]HOL09864.1 ribonuclease III [Bacillota bacterium]HPO97576.1 ribonuclease III [Bacillota bacterium]